jgi:hypothetical protein
MTLGPRGPLPCRRLAVAEALAERCSAIVRSCALYTARLHVLAMAGALVRFAVILLDSHQGEGA